MLSGSALMDGAMLVIASNEKVPKPPKLDKMDEAKKCMQTGAGYRSLLRAIARVCQIQR